MGKFDGILLCSDLDGTLLDDNKKISADNKNAIEYFQKEGGYFTFATGRPIITTSPYLDIITPNAPVILLNGAALYDYEKDIIIKKHTIDDTASDVIDFVIKGFPNVGVQVNTFDNIYIHKSSSRLLSELKIDKSFTKSLEFQDINEEKYKIIFVVEKDELPYLRNAIINAGFSDKYSFMQCSEYFFELLSKNASKGYALSELSERLNITDTIGIGDNENDLIMLKTAKIGASVKNANPILLEEADYITTDNNNSPIYDLIRAIDNNNLKF